MEGYGHYSVMMLTIREPNNLRTLCVVTCISFFVLLIVLEQRKSMTYILTIIIFILPVLISNQTRKELIQLTFKISTAITA